MPKAAVSVAIVSIEGTNNDEELAVALRAVGAQPEIVHLKQLEHRDVEPDEYRNLHDYRALFLPGGFSAGDYVRAGAVLAARLRAAIGSQLEEYIQAGHVVGGVCNGFQVLTELGLLPGRSGGRLGPPEAALMTNDSARYECRPTYVAWAGGLFPPLKEHAPGERFLFPSGHSEGKLVLSGDPVAHLRELEENGQVLFRWVAPDGAPAKYPWNPNGTFGNVAGLTNPEGNVFGLMPHPERALSQALRPDWTRAGGPDGPGDGSRFLDAIVRHLERRG